MVEVGIPGRVSREQDRLLVLQPLLAPLAAAQSLAALYCRPVVRYDGPDSLFKQRRQPKGHAIDLQVKQTKRTRKN